MRRVSAGALAVAVVLLALALIRVGSEPSIEIDAAMPGIGQRTPVTIGLNSEDGRGLAEIEVSLEQGETTVRLADRSYRPRPFWAFWGERVRRDQIVLEIGKQTVPELVEGEATVVVTAQRAGSWLRSPAPAISRLTLPVRLTPPRLVLLARASSLSQGGSGAVAYRVGPTAVEDGVRVGGLWFPGYPLPDGDAGDRFALFGAPHDLEDLSEVRLVAVDDVGNETAIPFVENYLRRPPTDDTIRLSDGFLERVVPAIQARTPGLTEGADLLASYLEINGELRRRNARQLTELAATSAESRLWQGGFRQLPGSQVMAPFADRRTYLYGDRTVDRQVHLGFDLASVRQAPVTAAGAGRVALAEYFGIYGNTVVVDHGYGLMSLYAHLSSIAVAVGDGVATGQELGRTGETGLAGGDHLHFSFLIQGLPVNPVEWWDPRWVRDRIIAVLESGG